MGCGVRIKNFLSLQKDFREFGGEAKVDAIAGLPVCGPKSTEEACLF